jgi:hypothetical protein
LRSARITQESLDTVVLEIMGNLDDESRAAIAGRLRTAMEKPDLKVVFEEVDEIKPDPRIPPGRCGLSSARRERRWE